MNVTETRLVELYEGASMEARAAGRNWYARAHEVARAIAERADVELERAAAAVAAASPRTTWSANVATAAAVARAHRDGRPVPDRLPGIPTLGRNIQAAASALVGGPYPAGPKVRSFYCNIVTRGAPCSHDVPCVTIDTIAARAALDVPRGAGVPRVTAKMYGELADAYRRAATAIGEAPAQFQATIWVAWRGYSSVGRDWTTIQERIRSILEA